MIDGLTYRTRHDRHAGARRRARAQRRARPLRAQREPPLRARTDARRGAARRLGARRRDARARRVHRSSPCRAAAARAIRWSARSSRPACARVEPKQAWTDVARFAAARRRRGELRARRERAGAPEERVDVLALVHEGYEHRRSDGWRPSGDPDYDAPARRVSGPEVRRCFELWLVRRLAWRLARRGGSGSRRWRSCFWAARRSPAWAMPGRRRGARHGEQAVVDGGLRRSPLAANDSDVTHVSRLRPRTIMEAADGTHGGERAHRGFRHRREARRARSRRARSSAALADREGSTSCSSPIRPTRPQCSKAGLAQSAFGTIRDAGAPVVHRGRHAGPSAEADQAARCEEERQRHLSRRATDRAAPSVVATCRTDADCEWSSAHCAEGLHWARAAVWGH